MTQISNESPSKAHRWTLAIVATAFILVLAYLLRYVLLPFIVAGALAYVSMPLVRWIQDRTRLPRWAAALAPFMIVMGVLAAMALGVKIYLAPQVNALLADQSILERFLDTLFRGHAIVIGQKPYSAHAIAQMLLNSVRANFDPREVLANIGFVIALLMGVVLTLVLLLYFLIEGQRLGNGLLWVVPPALRPQALSVARRSGPVVRAYVRGILVITAYAVALSFVVTKFILHLENALVLSLAVGLLELVPVIGPILAVTLLGFVAIGQITFWRIIGVALFTTALRVSIDQFVGPIVLGRSVKIPPPLIIFSFMAGGAIWGVLGVVIAIPAAAILKIILEEAYSEKRVEQSDV